MFCQYVISKEWHFKMKRGVFKCKSRFKKGFPMMWLKKKLFALPCNSPISIHTPLLWWYGRYYNGQDKLQGAYFKCVFQQKYRGKTVQIPETPKKGLSFFTVQIISFLISLMTHKFIANKSATFQVCIFKGLHTWLFICLGVLNLMIRVEK